MSDWSSPPVYIISAVWNTGILTITADEWTGYDGTYTLQVNQGDVWSDISTNSAFNIVTDGIITFVVSTPFNQAYQYRIKANDSEPIYYTEPEYATDTTIYMPPPETVPCFFGNAPVLTPTGYRRIDSLSVGDMVISASSTHIPIKNISITRCKASAHTNPYIISKGMFGANKDLLISPEHKVAIGNGRMLKAKDLGLTQQTLKGELIYYNLELPNWANMIVAGVEVESLAPVCHKLITINQLATLLKREYGDMPISDSILQHVLRICKLRRDGLIEAPLIRRH
jgi:hypothetical protein